MKVVQPNYPPPRTLQMFVRDPEHQLAVDPTLFTSDFGTLREVAGGVRLATHPLPASAAPELQSVVEVVRESLLPYAAHKMPSASLAFDGVEVILAGKDFWDRFKADGEGGNLGKALAAAGLAMKCYDIIAQVYPPLNVAQLQRASVGLLISIADQVFATYDATPVRTGASGSRRF